jgi:hypothetical protein
MYRITEKSMAMEFANINEAKEFVEEIEDKLGDGEELSKTFSDLLFNIECDYQTHHNLDPDNWDAVHYLKK